MSDPSCRSLVDVLVRRAAEQPRDRAYVFLTDRGVERGVLTFADLDHRSRALAARLLGLARPGERALLLFPPGLEFVVAFFACLYAGLIAVPVVPPRRHRVRDSTLSITRDCRPAVALTVAPLLESARSQVAERITGATRSWVTVDAGEADGTGFTPAALGPRDVAFLQYTSGSTSAPKGVVVRHGHLLANLAMIGQAFGNDRHGTYVSWIPLFHDMGLILVVLEALWAGAGCVLMAPTAFLHRPWLWLWAIHDYGARVAGAPNFAYDLCARTAQAHRLEGLDLTRWEIAFNGAEPVHAGTLARFTEVFAPYGFRREAFFPCYGMAEATVFVSGGGSDAPPKILSVSRTALAQGVVASPHDGADHHAVVGCGRAVDGERLVIVDPSTHGLCPPGQVGEIWVAGPHVTGSYWHNAEATVETFGGTLADTGEGPFLRTGDLGFLDAEGELFVTGRIKDLIVIRGANFYPQDLERAAAASHPALRSDAAAAFTTPGVAGDDRLVIVHEVEPSHWGRLDPLEVVAAVRRSLVEEFELTLHSLVLIRPGTIPKTSSGKIQRAATRQRYREGTLDEWAPDAPAVAREP